MLLEVFHKIPLLLLSVGIVIEGVGLLLLVAQITGKPARLALDIRRVPQRNKNSERRGVSNHRVAIQPHDELNLAQQIVVISHDLARLLRVFVVTDNSQSSAQIPRLQLGLDSVRALAKLFRKRGHVSFRRNSGTGVPPVRISRTTHGRDARATRRAIGQRENGGADELKLVRLRLLLPRDVGEVARAEIRVEPLLKNFRRLLLFLDAGQRIRIQRRRACETPERLLAFLHVNREINFLAVLKLRQVEIGRGAREVQRPVARVAFEAVVHKLEHDLVTAQHFGINLLVITLRLGLLLDARLTPLAGQTFAHRLRETGERVELDTVQRAEHRFHVLDAKYFRRAVRGRKRANECIVVELREIQRFEPAQDARQLANISRLHRARE